ncbi:hypothetical protein HY407_02040 [Candidatus Gottesmanbacteria bacterium]|nr:hypothetical protein [Candidatus Gottesmanbacteria bacterium]
MEAIETRRGIHLPQHELPRLPRNLTLFWRGLFGRGDSRVRPQGADALSYKEPDSAQEQFIHEFLDFIKNNQEEVDVAVRMFSGPDKEILRLVFQKKEDGQIIPTGSQPVEIFNHKNSGLTQFNFSAMESIRNMFRGNTTSCDVGLIWNTLDNRAVSVFLDGMTSNGKLSKLFFCFFPQEVTDQDQITRFGTFPYILQLQDGATFSLDDQGIHGVAPSRQLHGEKMTYHFFPIHTSFSHDGQAYFPYGSRISTSWSRHFDLGSGGGGGLLSGEGMRKPQRTKPVGM